MGKRVTDAVDISQDNEKFLWLLNTIQTIKQKDLHNVTLDDLR